MSKNTNVVAKRFKDSKNPSVTLVEYVPAPQGRSTRFLTACTVCGKPMSFKTEVNNPVCGQCTAKAREEELKSRAYVTCKDCGQEFYIKKGEADHLKELGFGLYTRCYSCRRKVKAK